MNVIAHIGNVPVEEWVPFLVPVLGLIFWGADRTAATNTKSSASPNSATG